MNNDPYIYTNTSACVKLDHVMEQIKSMVSNY